MSDDEPGDSDGIDSAHVELLAHDRRRRVVELLSSADTVGHTLASLASDLAERERREGDADVSADDLRVVLHHIHLPKLDDAGVIDYDPDTNRIEYRSDPDIEALLSLLSED